MPEFQSPMGIRYDFDYRVLTQGAISKLSAIAGKLVTADGVTRSPRELRDAITERVVAYMIEAAVEVGPGDVDAALVAEAEAIYTDERQSLRATLQTLGLEDLQTTWERVLPHCTTLKQRWVMHLALGGSEDTLVRLIRAIGGRGDTLNDVAAALDPQTGD